MEGWNTFVRGKPLKSELPRNLFRHGVNKPIGFSSKTASFQGEWFSNQDASRNPCQ
jgi:hypothetical protein